MDFQKKFLLYWCVVSISSYIIYVKVDNDIDEEAEKKGTGLIVGGAIIYHWAVFLRFLTFVELEFL